MRKIQSKEKQPVIRDEPFTVWDWVQAGIIVGTFVLLIIARILGWTGE